jgi:hypothetical protein
MRTTTILAALIALTPGCVESATPSDPSGLGDADQPDSKADGPNPGKADRACKIILRSVVNENVQAPDGSFIFAATVDVADSLGAPPHILWRSNEGSVHAQNDATAVAIDGAAAGYQRYRLELTHDTFAGGDGEAEESLQIDLIPFVRLSNKTLYDHNRVANSDYVLWSGDTAGGLVTAPTDPSIGAGFAIEDDSNVCR